MLSIFKYIDRVCIISPKQHGTAFSQDTQYKSSQTKLFLRHTSAELVYLPWDSHCTSLKCSLLEHIRFHSGKNGFWVNTTYVTVSYLCVHIGKSMLFILTTSKVVFGTGWFFYLNQSCFPALLTNSSGSTKLLGRETHKEVMKRPQCLASSISGEEYRAALAM